MELREIRDNEIELLQDFLYEAIFIPEGVEPPARDIIEQPELKLYYEGFGKGMADYCIVAEDDGRVVGAVWTRIMNDYGHVDDDTPSFAISLYKEYRGQGIGTQLMKDMLALLKKKAMREHRWQYKKPIMLSGCTRRSDSGLWMRMTKSLLWCVNYESDQLF